MKKEVIGNATLYLGDCMEAMQDIADGTIDSVISDPPYGIDYLSNMTDNHHKLVSDGYDAWLAALPSWFRAMKRVLKEEGVACCCCGGGGKTPVTAVATLEFIKHFHLITTVVWDKQRIGMGWHYRPQYETVLVGSKTKDKYSWHTDRKNVSNVIQCGKIIPQKGEHPTVKPVRLMKEFVLLHTLKDEIVLDPFMGSGTTGVAAIEAGRKFVGMELDPEYYDLARRRIDAAVSQLRMF